MARVNWDDLWLLDPTRRALARRWGLVRRRWDWLCGSAALAFWLVAAARGQPLATWLALRFGPGWPVAAVAALVGALLVALVRTAAAALVVLPTARAVGLVCRPPRAWLGDQVKAAAWFALLAGLGAGGLAWLVTVSPDHFWIGAGLGAAAAAAATGALGPLWGHPGQYRPEPLPPAWAARLAPLLDRWAGGARAQVLPVGRDTRLANALAAVRRGHVEVVVTDTLLDVLPPAELAAVVAHELAHLRLRHPGRGLVVAAAVSGVMVAAAGRLATVIPPPFPAWGLWGRFGLLVVALYLAAWPAAAWVSRRAESAADALAVTMTGDPWPLARALARLADANLTPAGDRGLASWLGTHPTLDRRLVAAIPGLAEGFAPRPKPCRTAGERAKL